MTPKAPQPTRAGAIYDLKLADIYIAAGTIKITQAEITDTRLDTAVCGWVVATVKQIDFSQIQAQFDAYFAQYKINIADQYQDYTANIKKYREQAKTAYTLMIQTFNTYAAQQRELYEGWIAEQEFGFEEWSGKQQATFEAWRKNQESAFNNWYYDNTGAWENGFLSWFDRIKGIFDVDPAGHLQNEIEALQDILYSGKVPASLITADGDELITTDGDRLIAFWTLKTSETCQCATEVSADLATTDGDGIVTANGDKLAAFWMLK